MIPSLARPLLLAANGLGNRLTDIAIELVPESVDRSTVRLQLTGLPCTSACMTAVSILLYDDAGGDCSQGRLGIAGCCYCKESFRGETHVHTTEGLYHVKCII